MLYISRFFEWELHEAKEISEKHINVSAPRRTLGVSAPHSQSSTRRAYVNFFSSDIFFLLTCLTDFIEKERLLIVYTEK